MMLFHRKNTVKSGMKSEARNKESRLKGILRLSPGYQEYLPKIMMKTIRKQYMNRLKFWGVPTNS